MLSKPKMKNNLATQATQILSLLQLLQKCVLKKPDKRERQGHPAK
jgi:hypothetical protein